MNALRTAVVGCGLIGRRRAAEAKANAASQLALVVDPAPGVAASVAAEFGCAAASDWHHAVEDPSIDVVVVATPNGYLRDIAVAALGAGKHVLLEKPMGRNLEEARAIARAAQTAGKLVKVGFNHRYHPALSRAHAAFAAGEIGPIISIRARYGHGGRAGYENDWRGNPELAGGGELTDQGVHVLDLINWFLGAPDHVVAFGQTAVWPIAPLEDNGFAMLRFAGGAVATLHTSWTQWKNLFSFEIFGASGALLVEGLGKSYGVETLTTQIRKPEGGAPLSRVETFDGPDDSWRLEWDEFTRAIVAGSPYTGTPADGVAVMSVLADLYESIRTTRIIERSNPVSER